LERQLEKLTAISEYIYDLTNIVRRGNQPYVGKNAFTHKAGVHVDAQLKNYSAYEHIDPSLIGNQRELSISELSGKSSVIKAAAELNIKLGKGEELVERVLRKVKELESQGYFFENAQASVHLILLNEAGLLQQPFQITSWRATSEMNNDRHCTAEIVVDVGGEVYHEETRGVGPVHALDVAFKRAVLHRFPQLASTNLVNYKVTVVDSLTGTASVVRVFIEFEDNGYHWATTAVSPNILEASVKALSEGYVYKLAVDKYHLNKGKL
jgi:2-isopropylmalate synthase